MASVFLASSTEARPYAEALAGILAEEGASALEWWSEECFPPNATLIDSLWRISDEVDAAIILASADDRTVRRGSETRDAVSNVILEYGLLSGRLGRQNVVLVEIGQVGLPSDLDGLKNIRVRSLTGSDMTACFASEARTSIVRWLRDIEARSSDGRRLAELVRKTAPQANESERAQIKASILRTRISSSNYVRLPPQTLEHLVLKYLRSTGGEEVGYERRSRLDYYLDFGQIPERSADLRALAGHLAAYVADYVQSKKEPPTLLAISKTATQGVLRAAAEILPYPLVLVSPFAPSRNSLIEGAYEPGDRALLLHDVVLSGQHLVDCATTLRRHRVSCSDLVALTRHEDRCRDLLDLAEANRLDIRTASSFVAAAGRVICGDLGLAARALLEQDCVLCQAIVGDPRAPVRSFIDYSDLPSEVLSETAGFAVISDVAPAVPGHVLIVTKSHYQALAKLPLHLLQALDPVVRDVRGRLDRIYGLPTVVFEHGMCD